MSAVIFDGEKEAGKREIFLRERVTSLVVNPRLWTVVFAEDPASQVYAGLKQEAAVRVGVGFDRLDCSFSDEVEVVVKEIVRANGRAEFQGVMVQKPSKQVWREHSKSVTRNPKLFEEWWRYLANAIAYEKDVDCLSERRLHEVYAGKWKVLPATVKAVLGILEQALGRNIGRSDEKSAGVNHWQNHESRITNHHMYQGITVSVVGRSELVGWPLAAVLEQCGARVHLLGSNTSDLGKYILGSEVVVSATGVEGLIGADLVREGAVIIDVGSPKPDVDFERVKEKVSFITPVPNGVGPITVVSLLENLVEL